MRSLVGPVPEPAERAGSALRRCARAMLSAGTAAPIATSHITPPAPMTSG